ncbi:MAG: P-loop NTPase fold protein, partial [Candidatus Binataceae bacterium]
AESGSKKEEIIPERIILYIDDLDRCPEDKVYAVLQAIHLLLAFESFVVVVGVDVTWVQNALARDLVGADERVNGNGAIKRQRAIEYLEKIFQIAFWLGPLTNDAKDGGTFAKFLRELVKPKAKASDDENASNEAQAKRGSNGAADAGPQGDTSNGSRQEQSDDEGRNSSVGDKGEKKLDDEIPTLGLIQLEQQEIDFLASPAIAGIAPTTPRSVKRMLNIYRLVRTRLGESGADIMGKNGGPAVYPLIALASALETRQAETVGDDLVNVADLVYQALKALPPDASIFRFLDDTSGPLKTAIHACPALKQALVSVSMQKREGRLQVTELLAVARVARRYSFNREESSVISPAVSPDARVEPLAQGAANGIA